MANRKITPENVPTWVRVRGWFKVRIGGNLQGAVSQRAIFLVPLAINVP